MLEPIKKQHLGSADDLVTGQLSTMSRSSVEEVMITTRVARVRASALRRRSTSIPSTFGISMSSSTSLSVWLESRWE
jgi:hypothetical protein